ncbi:uncharacterized protein ISCGN_000927 [Ixodes scapularis]
MHDVALFLLAAASLVVSGAQDTAENVTVNGDDIIDGLLRQFRENRDIQSKIDPLVIRQRLNLDDGKGYVENVVVYGLPSLRRYGTVNVTLHGSHLATARGRLGAENIRMSGRYQYKVNRFFRLNGDLGATLSRILADITIEVDVESKRATLKYFKIVDMGDLKVTKFTGASFAFNWLGKAILNKVLQSKNSYMSDHLEARAAEALNKLLQRRAISV